MKRIYWFDNLRSLIFFLVVVYHVIVLGVFSTILLPANLPAVVKWVLTIICTYAGSNLIVAGYKSIMTGPRTVKLLEESE